MTRNSEVLKSFTEYCLAHPDDRFWQALRNWSTFPFIFAGDPDDNHDTFYWEGRGPNIPKAY
jgi:hypothetical protein